MNRRALHVLGALAVLMAVAVLARPSQPEVPPPFTVDRETPEPDAAPTGGEPESTPSPDDPPGARREPPSRTILTLHTVDSRTLAPDGPPATLRIPTPRARAQLSPDSRWLAVAIPQPHPAAATLLPLYGTEALAAGRLDPAVEIAVPAFADWFAFAPEGDGVLWLENHERAGLRAGGATFDGSLVRRRRSVDLPPDLWIHSIAALRDGRVGLVAVAQTGRSPAGWGLAVPRLLVADVGEGTLAVDLELPVAKAMSVADEAGRVELVPGIAWDVARDRLYVAPAERDALLVADLAQGTLTQALEMPDPRGDDETGTATADHIRPSAVAQPADTLHAGTWREATLSDDGAVLYVHGSYLGAGEPPVEGQPAPPRERLLPLLGFDAHTLEALGIGEPPHARVLAVSPGAEHLFVAQAFLLRGTPPMLRLLDGRTFEERWHTSTGDDLPGLARFSDDAQRLALALQDRDGGDAASVVVHDSATGEVLGHATFPGRVLAIDLDAGLLVTGAFE